MANDDDRRDREPDRERGSDERETRHSRPERMGDRKASASSTDGGADDAERSPWKSSRNQG